MARPKKNEGPHIFWRKGRAYADLRAYADVGGKKEALAAPSSKWGTTDAEIALSLFEARLDELKRKRKGRAGVDHERVTTLAELVRSHLIMKARAGKTSDSHLSDLETRLRVAIEYFGAARHPRTIEPAEVRAWSEELAVGGGGRRSGTIRHYLNALSGLYRRAQEGLYVPPGYNPVAALVEKPTSDSVGDAKFFEVAEAALLLESSYFVEARDRNNSARNLPAIIATFLLTGGRFSEVVGLDVEDVSFDRDLIRFRRNQHRRLKTKTSVRDVPIWPQLREILQRHVFERGNVSGLLFPGCQGFMIRDLRKSLDQMGALCGIDAGEVRTKALRHTYCTTRLATVQRILRPGRNPETDDAFDYVEVSRFQVSKEMGHGGTQLVDRIYGHATQSPHRSEVVEYRVENHRGQLGERLTSLSAISQSHA